MKISISRADLVFSQYIRLRDKKCIRCGSPVAMSAKGLPVSHTNSHYFGRGRENTRFDPENCDTLCLGCHRFWGSDNREDYRAFKIKQLGEVKFNHLCVRAEQYKKKDRALMLMAAKELLKLEVEKSA